jgi:hypothetical protein
MNIGMRKRGRIGNRGGTEEDEMRKKGKEYWEEYSIRLGRGR